MRTHTKIITGTVLLVAASWFAGCNYPLDEAPNVVLEVATMTIPTVTGTLTGGSCVFTIVDATATFNNKAKNHLAGEPPFNDIVMRDVLVHAVWDDGFTVFPDQSFPVAGTIPADGTQSLSFGVVNNVTLTGPSSRAGHSANLDMTFHGRTISEEDVSVSAGRTMNVNPCVALGACCTGVNNTSCALRSQAACAGTYKGDDSTCTVPGCP